MAELIGPGAAFMAGIKGAVQKLASQAEIASDADVILESAGKFEDTTVYKRADIRRR